MTAQGFVPYASYATSFEAQIGGDSVDNTLEPTRGKQVELGVKYQPAAFDGYFTAAVFDLRQTDDPLVFAFAELFVDEAAYRAHQARTRASDWGAATADIARAAHDRRGMAPAD